MKNTVKLFGIIALVAIIGFTFVSCASKPKVKIVEMENKGTVLKAPTPAWVTNYIQYGIAKVQAQTEFKDKYCVIGEESGVNRQFVTT
jgi:hypothetical protein